MERLTDTPSPAEALSPPRLAVPQVREIDHRYEHDTLCIIDELLKHQDIKSKTRQVFASLGRKVLQINEYLMSLCAFESTGHIITTEKIDILIAIQDNILSIRELYGRLIQQLRKHITYAKYAMDILATAVIRKPSVENTEKSLDEMAACVATVIAAYMRKPRLHERRLLVHFGEFFDIFVYRFLKTPARRDEVAPRTSDSAIKKHDDTNSEYHQLASEVATMIVVVRQLIVDSFERYERYVTLVDRIYAQYVHPITEKTANKVDFCDDCLENERQEKKDKEQIEQSEKFGPMHIPCSRATI